MGPADSAAPSADLLRRALLLPALGLVLLALGGCETTAEKSSALARKFHPHTLVQHGLSVTRVNREVKVLDASIVHDSNGTAVVITLRNQGSRALRNVPIAIALKDSAGKVVFQNNAAGLDPSLTSTALLPPHQSSIWVDDQVQSADPAASVTARIGEATATATATTSQPQIQGAHLVEDPANGNGVQGSLINRSTTAQQSLVVYAVARRNGKVVAAGRALLPSLPARGSSPFEVFFIGNPAGAQLKLSAAAAA